MSLKTNKQLRADLRIQAAHAPVRDLSEDQLRVKYISKRRYGKTAHKRARNAGHAEAIA